MTSEKSFELLRARLSDVHNLRAAAAVLEWDQEVFMPPRGAAARGRQLATVSAIAHERFVSPEIGCLLEEAESESDALSGDSRMFLRETRYDYERAARIPEAFMRRFSEARSAAFHGWLDARKRSDFASFLPHLEGLVALSREKAELLGYSASPYDVLLDEYERGMTVARIRPVFDALAKRQSALVARIVASPRQPDLGWLDRDWNVERQWQFTERVLRDMGYDFDAGRQDKSAHPFTTNFSIGDVRITTRLNEREFFSALFGSIHEGGHALYEQGYLPEDEGTVLAEAPSLGMHESQSRMWENMIGRSLPFWEHYLPVLRDIFPDMLDGVEPEDVHRAANHVSPSLIRVEADECTYNLHVILRFELETALLEGTLKPADLPDAWNARMKEYLGIDVPDDARGCLQDVHWSHGAFGYFPTYALGNVYAAQLFEVILRDVPDLWSCVGRGEFMPLLDWLRAHVHRIGRRRTAAEIVEACSGAPPAPDAYLAYLESKYTALYSL